MHSENCFQMRSDLFLLDWGQLVKHKGQSPGLKVPNVPKEEKYFQTCIIQKCTTKKKNMEMFLEVL